MIATATFFLGAIVATAGAGEPEVRTVTVTSLVTATTQEQPPTTVDAATTTAAPTTRPPATQPQVAAQFGDGQYRVGKDIRAGTYRTAGENSCYWARLKSFSGDFDAIIANGNTSGQAIVRIASSDFGFETRGGCQWRRISG